MILRRPFAFLIKYFKLIHIIMFIGFSYLVFVIRKIYVFFSDYVKTSNFTYFENMTSKYVPIFAFIVVLIILGLAISILLLMRRKDKPIAFYKFVIGYCSVLLIALIYFFAFFKSLDTAIYEPLRLVVNRDIVLFIYLINFGFVILSFIRGFGFDIKKFSFEKDKRELNLEESDSEEVEVNVKFEKEDVVNYINRQKREFTYYVKENSTILTIAGGVLLFIIVVVFLLNHFVFNKVYSEGSNVDTGRIVYKANSSYISNYDKYGKSLAGEDNYLIVNFDITSRYTDPVVLDKQALRVHIGDEYYYPTTSVCDLFDDMGTCYRNQELRKDKTYNYIAVYKIKKASGKVYWEVLKDKKDGYRYIKVSLSHKDIKREDVMAKLNDTFIFGNTTHQITKYELLEKTEYEYEECVNEKCNNYTKVVSPKIGEIVLVLDISDLDKLSNNFLNSAFGLKYDGKSVYGNEIKYLDKHDNKVYFSVTSNIKSVSSLTLTIMTRSKLYNFVLNGG